MTMLKEMNDLLEEMYQEQLQEDINDVVRGVKIA